MHVMAESNHRKAVLCKLVLTGLYCTCAQADIVPLKSGHIFLYTWHAWQDVHLVKLKICKINQLHTKTANSEQPDINTTISEHPQPQC